MDNQNQNNLVSSSGQKPPIVRDGISVLFSNDSYGLFVFQKTEKIVKAVYLLTSLMSDKEPMKERSRTLVNGILENVLNVSERVWNEDKNNKKILSSISEIILLFEVAEYTGMMSKMNKQIINTELQKLSNFIISSYENSSSAKVVFEQNMFDKNYDYVPKNTFNGLSFSNNQNTIQKDDEQTLNIINKGQDEMSDMSLNNKTSFIKIVHPQKKIKDKNNRQDIIFKMLNGGAKLTIKDFAKNIKGCSEKTIQRELISMLEKGVLKKEGERRWSKYFLK
jgi:hypothetical protein